MSSVTRFSQALADYGLGKCVANETTLWIGADGSRDWPNASRIGLNEGARARMDFLAAPVQAELVAAFVNSSEALVVEELFIGTSQWYFNSYSREAFPGYDMSEAVAALHGAHLPALRSLTLGDMEDLSGGLRMFGTVGEIGPVFAAAPQLDYLGLHGNFELDAPVRHDRLGVIEALFDSSGITGEAISQATFGNLLMSNLPELRQMLLELSEGGGDDDLTLPDGFLAPGHWPALGELELDRLAPVALSQLAALRRERGLA